MPFYTSKDNKGVHATAEEVRIASHITNAEDLTLGVTTIEQPLRFRCRVCDARTASGFQKHFKTERGALNHAAQMHHDFDPHSVPYSCDPEVIQTPETLKSFARRLGVDLDKLEDFMNDNSDLYNLYTFPPGLDFRSRILEDIINKRKEEFQLQRRTTSRVEQVETEPSTSARRSNLCEEVSMDSEVEEETVESQTVEFQENKSQISQSQASQPQVSQLLISQPQVYQSLVTQSRTIEPPLRPSQVFRPHVLQPPFLQSRITEPQTIEPQLLQSQVLRSQVSASKTPESQNPPLQITQSQIPRASVCQHVNTNIPVVTRASHHGIDFDAEILKAPSDDFNPNMTPPNCGCRRRGFY